MTPRDPLSETGVERKIADVLKGQNGRSRWLEDAAFVVAIMQAVGYGVAEMLGELGVRFGACEVSTGFPYITVIVFLGCVAPKMLGRATAGKIWERIPFLGGK